MRLGWDEAELNAPGLARRAEAAGVRMLTVHGRTRCQFYKGRADWAAIHRVVEAVSIPVVANGDIVDATSARVALARSGAAGVMVGRGAIGRPWMLAEIAAGLAGRSADPRPRGPAFAALVARHCRLHIAFYGERTGVKAMRKHLDAYIAQVPGAAGLRAGLIRETDPGALFTGIARLGELDVAERLAA
jgi:tRNA-dihydrouridine synthase